MPHGFGTKIGAIGSKVAHAAQTVVRKVHEARTKDKKPLHPPRTVNQKRVRFDGEVETNGRQLEGVESNATERENGRQLEGVESNATERGNGQQVDEADAFVRLLTLNKAGDVTEFRDYIREGANRFFDAAVERVLKRADRSQRATDLIRNDLGECLKSYNSRQLKGIIRNAVQAHAPAADDPTELKNGWDKHQQNDGETQITRYVMKLVVEACLDRLSEKKKKYVLLTEFLPKTDQLESFYAFRMWVLEPGKELVQKIPEGKSSHDLEKYIKELALGYKAFGGRMTNALFEEFRAKNAWNRDGVIEEIGRRAAALEESATTPDLRMAAHIMRQVHFAYRLAEIVRDTLDSDLKVEMPLAMARLNAAPVPEPTAYDKLWVDEKIAGGDLNKVGTGQDATNDPTQEEDEPVHQRFQDRAAEEPPESQRLSQEVTDLMLELTARRQLHVIPLLPPQRASLRDEFPPFDWELGESHFDGWRPSPSAAAEQLFNAIEARDVQGYIASLNVLDGLGADQGSKAVSLALDDVFKARSKPDRSTMANNIGALHAALAGEAGVDEDILARSKEIADWLGATQEVPSISVEQDEVPVEKIADVEATAKKLFNSIEAGDAQGYVASLELLDKLNKDDGINVHKALSKARDRRSKSSLDDIFHNSERVHKSVAKRKDVDPSIRELSEQFTLLVSPSAVIKKLLDSIEILDVENYEASLGTLKQLITLRRKSVEATLGDIFDHRSNASRWTISDVSGEMHAALLSRGHVKKTILKLSDILSKQLSAAVERPATQTGPRRKPRALKRRGAARQAQPMTAPPRDKGSDLAPVRRRRPQALPPKPQEPAPIPQIILPGPEQAQVLPDKVPVEKIADVEATAKKLFDSIEAGDAQGYVASLELLDKLNKDDDINVDNALSEALDLRSKSSLGDIFNNSERVHKSVAKRKDVDPSIRELSEQFTKQLGAAVERPATQTGPRQKPPILKRRGAARPLNAPPRNNGADPAAARRRRPKALPPKPLEPAPIPQIILPGPEQAQAQALPDRKTQAVKDAVRPEHGRAPEANQAPRQPSMAWKPGEKRPVQPGYPTVGPRLGQGKVKTPPKEVTLGEVTLGNEQYGALFDLVGDSLTAQRPETARRLVTKPPVSPEPTTVNGGESLIHYDAGAPVLVKESPPVQQPVSLSETAKRDRAKFAENLVAAIDKKNFLDLFIALHGLSKSNEDDRKKAVMAALGNQAVKRGSVQAIEGTVITLWSGLDSSKRFDAEDRIAIARIFNTWSGLNRGLSGLAVFSTSANSRDLNAAREALNEMFGPDKFRPDQDPEDVVPDYLKS